MNLVDAIMIAEDSSSTERDKLEAIAFVAKSGVGQSLQGSWVTAIAKLREHGLLTEDNEIDWDLYNEMLENED